MTHGPRGTGAATATCTLLTARQMRRRRRRKPTVRREYYRSLQCDVHLFCRLLAACLTTTSASEGLTLLAPSRISKSHHADRHFSGNGVISSYTCPGSVLNTCRIDRISASAFTIDFFVAPRQRGIKT